MLAQQAPLACAAGGQHCRVEAPVQIGRELLRHHPPPVVHLQQVARAVRRAVAVAAAGMPEFAAKEQHVAGSAQHRLGRAVLPLVLVRAGRAAGAVTAGDHQGRAEVRVDRIEIEMRRADLHGQPEGRVGEQGRRQFHDQVVQVQVGADEARMAAPGGLADHVAVGAERGLGQFDHPRQVEVGQPQWRAVEDTLPYNVSLIAIIVICQ